MAVISETFEIPLQFVEHSYRLDLSSAQRYKKMYFVFSAKGYCTDYSEQEFSKIVNRIECAAEIGVQYPNLTRINWLKFQKSKGAKIYIVSDFHLGKDFFVSFLKVKNIDVSLFDGIFVSDDVGCTKANNGELYRYVINKLSISPSIVLMVGDNRKADGVNARKCGIEAEIHPNYIAKIKYQINRFVSKRTPKSLIKNIRQDCYKYSSPFTEYSIIFNAVVKRFYNEITNRGNKSVVFLAREGYYLKQLFEGYQSIRVPRSKHIIAEYLYCSRRAAQSLNEECLSSLVNSRISVCDLLKSYGFSVSEIERIRTTYDIKEDEFKNSSSVLSENRAFCNLKQIDDFNRLLLNKVVVSKNAFNEYLHSKLHSEDPSITVIDIGWRGSMQDAISAFLKRDVYGLYLGLNSADKYIHKKGVLFEYSTNEVVKSQYAQILRANIQLYEQLTAAPHGSTLGYTFNKEGVAEPSTEWLQAERTMYNKVIKECQNTIYLLSDAISVWCDHINDDWITRLCAKIVLRSALIADEDRLQFLQALDNGFVGNFNKEEIGLKFDKQQVKINYYQIIFHPEDYTRYFAKIQRYLQKESRLAQKLYIPIAYAAKMYIWAFAQIHNCKIWKHTIRNN
jgi:hypothetical protein